MSDRPDKEKIMKMVVPALAVAVVIVLVGILIAFRNNTEPSVAANNGGKPNLNPSIKVRGSEAMAVDTEGLTLEKPPENAPEWKEIGEGLKVWDVKEGTGTACPPGASVTIHYTGWTLNGNIFDSSVQRNEEITFPLGDLIPGWQKGIPGMKRGGIRRLYIPWPMAYGERGSPPKIPPRADLIFEIKMFDFK